MQWIVNDPAMTRASMRFTAVGSVGMLALVGVTGCSASQSESIPVESVTTNKSPTSVEPNSTETAELDAAPDAREPTRIARSFAKGLPSQELLRWSEIAVDAMAEPPTDFMGMIWPIGEELDEIPDPQVFDGDPFREHAPVLSPSDTDEAVLYFKDWQSGLEGCETGEVKDFDSGADRVERWIRGGADVATAPDPCFDSRAAVAAWTSEQGKQDIKHIFLHESYHALQNYLLKQCAPILGREEDSMNELRWFSEGTADYFSMYLQAQDGGSDDYVQQILERAHLDLLGDPGMSLNANTYVQTAAMVLMIERGLITEEKIIDGSYFHNCDWINDFDPSRPDIAAIFEDFDKIENSGGRYFYSNQVIKG
jgi:hypothetical protein